MNPAEQSLLAMEKVERSRLVARLIRITGDWSLAEDCVQDAFVKAWQLWSKEGVPEKPGAWLAAVAKNRALDRWRRAKVEAEKLRLWDVGQEFFSEEDDRLALIFTCCHPSLPLEGQVALTLRTVAGLTTAEVARAFLVSEATMTRRLTRARTKIQAAGIPFALPSDPEKQERLAGVLGVLYLLFNQGNDAGPQDVDRELLAGEAIRLARLLTDLLPQEPEAAGALALMLLTRSRRPARFDADGPVTLDRQDRSLWDQALKDEGLASLAEALAHGTPGSYTLQAAIAGCHARAARAQDTDFRLIASLYARLESLAPSPVVRLNRAVAIGLAEGPSVGLALVEDLEGDSRLAGYHLLAAAKADFLGKLERWVEAAQSWDRAARLASSDHERQFLQSRRDSALVQAAHRSPDVQRTVTHLNA